MFQHRVITIKTAFKGILRIIISAFIKINKCFNHSNIGLNVCNKYFKVILKIEFYCRL